MKKIITRRGSSLYRTEEDPEHKRAFAGLDFRRRDVLAAQATSQYPFILQADISRFFYTVYTHSIPWAVLGKDKVKAWLANDRRRLNAHWSNALDSALQSCQSRETFGIPVGPDTSRVIAEVLLAGVESDAELVPWLQGRLAFRLLDDFMIGFEDESTAHKALAALRHALWRFNLQLNEDKTRVLPSRALLRDRWRLEFTSIQVSDSDPRAQQRDIYRLVELALHYCNETETATPAVWACRRLSRLRDTAHNFAIILDALFRLARDFPLCTSHVAEFLVNNQERCHEPDIRLRVSGWVKSMLLTHAPHGHDAEVAWCLLVAGILRVPLNAEDLPPPESMPNSVVFVMLGILRERGLLSVPLGRWGWRAEFKSKGLYSECWLPYYESVRRKWTRDSGMAAAVAGDAVMARMLSAGVTFLEDRVLDASNLSVSRRVFSRTATPKPPGAFAGLGSTSASTGEDIDALTGWAAVNVQQFEYDD